MVPGMCSETQSFFFDHSSFFFFFSLRGKGLDYGQTKVVGYSVMGEGGVDTMRGFRIKGWGWFGISQQRGFGKDWLR